MERYHLKTFITVAEEGHLTRAAQRLNTSQPAVNAHSRLDFHLLQRWTWQQFDDLAKGRIDAGFVYGNLHTATLPPCCSNAAISASWGRLPLFL